MDEQEHNKLRTRFLIAGLVLVAIVIAVKIYESRKNAAASASQPQDNSLSGSSGGLNVIEIMTQASGPAGAPTPPPNAPTQQAPVGPPQPGIAPSTTGASSVRATAVSRGAPARVPPVHTIGLSGIRQGWPPIQPSPTPQQSGKHAIPPVAPPRRQGKHSMPPQPAPRIRAA